MARYVPAVVTGPRLVETSFELGVIAKEEDIDLLLKFFDYCVAEFCLPPRYCEFQGLFPAVYILTLISDLSKIGIQYFIDKDLRKEDHGIS